MGGLKNNERQSFNSRYLLPFRFVNRAALVAGLMIGVTMAQPRMKDAHAQENRDVTKVQKATKSVAIIISEIRTAFSEMSSNGISPVQISISDPKIKSLVKSLEELDNSLKPFNNGSSVIPISGKNDLEKVQSLNVWLKRSKDAAIDESALTELEQKVMLASASISAVSTAVAVIPTPAVPSTTQTTPSVLTATPARVDRRAEFAQTLENLGVIAEHGRTDQVKRTAKSHIDKINKDLENDGKNLDKLNKDAQAFIKTELGKAQEKAASGTHVVSLSREEKSNSAEMVTDIVNSLKPITAPSSTASAEKKDQANQIINLAIDSWLLGSDPRGRMLEALKKAKEALLSDAESDRKNQFDGAKIIFTKEQELYRARLTKVIIPVAQASVEALGSSENPSLPTRAQLVEEGKKDGINYYPYLISGKSVPNGQEDLFKKFDSRLKEVKSLESKDKLSYYLISDLQDVVVTEDNVLQTIVDLWSFYKTNRVEEGTKSTIYISYALAISTLLDPNTDIFSQYPKQVQESIARLYLRRELGRIPNNSEIALALKEIIPSLMTQSDYKYDEVIQNFYNPVSNTFPKATGDGYSIAMLRVFRESLEYRVHDNESGNTYQKYLSGRKTVITEDPITGVQVTNDSLSNEELTSSKRLEFAQSILQDAIKIAEKNGIKDDDNLLKQAKMWLDYSKNIPPDKIPVVSDTLYHISLGLTSIAEAELWVKSSLGRPLTKDQKQQVLLTINQARRTYYWNFGSTKIESGWHSNISEEIANSAIRFMVPKALENLERSVVGTSFMYYDNPALLPGAPPVFANKDPKSFTETERLETAATSEARLIGLLQKTRDSVDFAVSEYESTERNARRSELLISYLYNRDPESPVSVEGFPILDRGSKKETLTDRPLDIHIVPYSADLPALSNQLYEDRHLKSWGAIYNQIRRLHIMRLATNKTPPLLRELDPNPYIERMNKASRTYATLSPEKQLLESNQIILDIVDARINQLSERLDGEITLANGEKYKRKELAESPQPGKRYVQRAIWALRDLRQIREDLVKNKKGDLYERPINPDQAIAIAEIAIQSLDDNVLKDVSPPISAPKQDLDHVSFFVPEKSIDIQRYTSFGHERRVRFTARDVSVRVIDGPQKGKVYTLEQFERAQAKAEKVTTYDINLTYYWFAYQYLGRNDTQGNEILYLRNPNYDQSSKEESKRNEYIGMIIRGATYTDGTKANDVVVRVRRNTSSDPSEHEWIPMYQDSRGRIRKEDVLFRVSENTRNPIRDDLLNKHLRNVAIQSTVNKSNVPENGDAYPALIIYPHSTEKK